jgi:hypothetical protein
MTEAAPWRMHLTMKPDERANQDVCPVCGTVLPKAPGVRRCPRCGARALAWRTEEPLEMPVVLFNARLAGIMAGIFTAMLALLVLGYRFPLPWGVALVAMALPVAGYITFGGGAQKVPASWRTQYLAGVLALDAGLLAAVVAGVMGLTGPMLLLAVTGAVCVLTWSYIRRAVTASRRKEE